MKIDFRKILCIIFAVVCTATAVTYYLPRASADETLDQMQKQYEDLEKQIQQNNQKLDEVNGEIKDNKAKLKKINGEISAIESQIDILDSRIDKLNSNIGSLQNKINTTSNDIEEIGNQIVEINAQIKMTDELMNDTRAMLLGRLRENYMAGEASMLEVIFSSHDISSYFARKELMTRVSENDAKLIQNMEVKIKELNDLNKQLAEQKVTLEGKKAELGEQVVSLSAQQTDLEGSKSTQESKKKEVDSKYREVQGIINDLDKDSAEYKAAIKAQEKQREALEAQIDEYIRQHGSKQGDTPDEAYQNDGNMMWPVKGRTTMTAGYPSYPSGGAHWGIDICVCDSNGNTRDSNGNSLSYGAPYYAAQGGKVMIAHNDGGWNSGFGNYCVIDHGDGTMTLYAHSKSLVVSEGDVVQKGQKLGYIGDTGNVTGPHLHFEVREKNADGSVSRVQPLKYVSNPGY